MLCACGATCARGPLLITDPTSAPARLCVCPPLQAERAPGWSPHARGSICGLNPGVTGPGILLATLESVALQLAQIESLLRQVTGDDGPPTPLIASGGALAENPLWRQLIADATGKPLRMRVVRGVPGQGKNLGGAAFAKLGVRMVEDDRRGVGALGAYEVGEECARGAAVLAAEALGRRAWRARACELGKLRAEDAQAAPCADARGGPQAAGVLQAVGDNLSAGGVARDAMGADVPRRPRAMSMPGIGGAPAEFTVRPVVAQVPALRPKLPPAAQVPAGIGDTPIEFMVRPVVAQVPTLRPKLPPRGSAASIRRTLSAQALTDMPQNVLRAKQKGGTGAQGHSEAAAQGRVLQEPLRFTTAAEAVAAVAAAKGGGTAEGLTVLVEHIPNSGSHAMLQQQNLRQQRLYRALLAAQLDRAT